MMLKAELQAVADKRYAEIQDLRKQVRTLSVSLDTEATGGRNTQATLKTINDKTDMLCQVMRKYRGIKHPDGDAGNGGDRVLDWLINELETLRLYG